jgi:hypothetical protein
MAATVHHPIGGAMPSISSASQLPGSPGFAHFYLLLLGVASWGRLLLRCGKVVRCAGVAYWWCGALASGTMVGSAPAGAMWACAAQRLCHTCVMCVCWTAGALRLG